MTIADLDACTTTSQMAHVVARHFAHLGNPLLRQPVIIQCTQGSMRAAIQGDDPRLLVHNQTGQPLFAAMMAAAMALAMGGNALQFQFS